MKSIKERAKEWGEHIIETTPYDVVDGKVCVFVEDRDIADVAEESYIAGATDQKVIDEEVRLKKSDDMAKAEYDRETAFADWYLKNGKGAPTFSDAIEWARKDVISKACDWLNRELLKLSMHELKDNFRDNEFKVVLKSQVSDWLIDFRKAMEE